MNNIYTDPFLKAKYKRYVNKRETEGDAINKDPKEMVERLYEIKV
jgi:hypothetical protein